MLRKLQVLFLCLCGLFAVVGCNEKVKEIPAKSETTETPTLSEQEKNALLEGENKHQEKAVKKKKTK